MKRLSKVCSLILSLASLVQIGCFAPSVKDPTLVMHVDTAYTKDERLCLEDSAQQWRNQTSGLANVSFEYDLNQKDPVSVLVHRLDHRVVRWTSQTPYVKLLEEMQSEPDKPYILLGQVNGKGTKDPFGKPIEMGLVSDRLTDPHVCRLTAIHELGHVFGVPHMPGPGSIMYPSIHPSRTACLKRDELTVFAQINGLPGELMRPCEEMSNQELVIAPPDEDLPSVTEGM